MANAGRILIIPKGEYNAETTYEMLDLVSYNGMSWLTKKTATGIEPSDDNSEYWFKFTDFSGLDDRVTAAEAEIDTLNGSLNNLHENFTNAGTIGLLNGATGTLGILKLFKTVYLIYGFVNATENKWFANFPVVPGTTYYNQEAKLTGVDESGNVVPILINNHRGMTAPTTGKYWINGIVIGSS